MAVSVKGPMSQYDANPTLQEALEGTTNPRLAIVVSNNRADGRKTPEVGSQIFLINDEGSDVAYVNFGRNGAPSTAKGAIRSLKTMRQKRLGDQVRVRLLNSTRNESVTLCNA